MTAQLEVGEYIALESVTREEFQAISCNQCGDCCERLWQEPPEKIQEWIQEWDLYNAHYSTDDLLGWLTIDEIIRRDRDNKWLKALTPTGVVHQRPSGPRHQYSCSYFQRTSESFGLCTNYVARPAACRNFPYGKPDTFMSPRCAFNVRLIDPIGMGD